ncbi:MAG: ribosome small subunit-dependent GTPase A [Erysipelotrichaceae bacterium]
MRVGTIIRTISNQYQVLGENEEIYDCLAMGKVRNGFSPVVGDKVNYEKLEDKYCIQKVLPRNNSLIRPSIANVDQAIIVMSTLDPDFSSVLIDRLIFLISYANIKPVLCITKMDLIKDELAYQVIIDKLDSYKNMGYEVYVTGKDYDVEIIKNLLSNKISVLTGQSGAGKSSLLNRIDPSFELKTQEISKALGRGKHTTRHCELHKVGDGWVADTPGFSSLDFYHMSNPKFKEALLPFAKLDGDCRFQDCNHIHEPGCAIKQAVEDRKIDSEYYQHYLEIVNIIQNKRVKY